MALVRKLCFWEEAPGSGVQSHTQLHRFEVSLGYMSLAPKKKKKI